MVDLQVNTLTVVKKADHIGRDEPMVWTLFVLIDLDTLNSHQFVVTTDAIAGKLAKAGKGDTVPIPASVGHFHSDASAIGTVGVVVIAFDNDLRSNNQIRDGYAAAATTLNQAILEHFPAHGFAPIGDAEKKQIQAKITDAVTNAFLADSVFATIFGGKPMGGDSFIPDLSGGNLNENFSMSLHDKHDFANYRVDGHFQFQR